MQGRGLFQSAICKRGATVSAQISRPFHSGIRSSLHSLSTSMLEVQRVAFAQFVVWMSSGSAGRPLTRLQSSLADSRQGCCSFVSLEIYLPGLHSQRPLLCVCPSSDDGRGRAFSAHLVCRHLSRSGVLWKQDPFKPDGTAYITHLNILLYPAKGEQDTPIPKECEHIQ